MVVLLEIVLQGFRSFAREQRFSFPGEGLFLMLGKNLVDPDLGGNAAGKSSFWDALVFVLYGKTSRGVKGPHLTSWTGEEDFTSVQLHLKVDGESREVQRTIGPNSLLLDGETVTQAEIDDLLGCSYRSFLNAVVMGQFSSYFLDLLPSKKLLLLDEVLQLHVWDGAAQLSRNKLKDTDAKRAEVELQYGRLQGRETELARATIDLQDSAAEFEIQRTKTLAALKEARAKTRRDLTGHRQDLQEVADALHALEGKEEDQLVKLTKLKDKEEKAIAAYARKDNVYSSARRSLADYPTEAGPCPECRQEVGEAHIKKIRATMRRALDRATESRSEARASLNAAREGLEGITTRLESLEERKKDLQAKRYPLRRKADRAKAAVESADRDIAREKDAKNRDEDRWQVSREKLKQVRKEMGEAQKEAKALYLSSDHYAYWADAFKQIRLLLVESALRELEAHTANSLVALGLEGWEVTFDVERASAKGSVVKGFTTFVTSPESGGPVPWESWCGGETQRLRIAGQIGVADLITNRTGFSCLLEVWDEPTAHLSPEGVDDLFRLFGERAREGRSVWVVDHTTPEHGDFSGVWEVHKTETGSAIQASSVS